MPESNKCDVYPVKNYAILIIHILRIARVFSVQSAMLAKQLDDALSGDWRGRGVKCASCSGQAGGAAAATRGANGSCGTESQPMSLLAELEQAEAASTQSAARPQPPPMVDVDLTTSKRRSDDHPNDFGSDAERLVTRLCDALERRAGHADAVSPELTASTRYRLLKLMGCGAGGGDGSAAAGVKSTGAVDLAELVRNRDGRVAELTCEVRSYCCSRGGGGFTVKSSKISFCPSFELLYRRRFTQTLHSHIYSRKQQRNLSVDDILRTTRIVHNYVYYAIQPHAFMV